VSVPLVPMVPTVSTLPGTPHLLIFHWLFLSHSHVMEASLGYVRMGEFAASQPLDKVPAPVQKDSLVCSVKWIHLLRWLPINRPLLALVMTVSMESVLPPQSNHLPPTPANVTLVTQARDVNISPQSSWLV